MEFLQIQKTCVEAFRAVYQSLFGLERVSSALFLRYCLSTEQALWSFGKLVSLAGVMSWPLSQPYMIPTSTYWIEALPIDVTRFKYSQRLVRPHRSDTEVSNN